MKKYHIISLLAALLFSTALFAQNKVSGTVTDENGVPLVGATVIVKGTPRGTTTDVNGGYMLTDVAAKATLQFSYIGYESQEIALNGRSTLDAKLAPSSIMMDEVVAIGYGTVRRKDLTGAVASVSAGDIIKTATSNYDQALAGRVAGVQVSSADGTPGQGLNIVIRGGNSITGDNSPLYVVDGIALEDFDPASISSNDIKDIDILKDASSTAIYGSRGANGVILITTKNGRTDGRTDVSVRASYGAAWIPTRLQVMSPYDYVRYQLEAAYASDGYNPDEKVRQFMKTWGDPEQYRNMKGTDWQDRIMRVAPFRSLNATLSGGTEKTSIYYSAEGVDEQGTLINTGFVKLTNNLKITHKFGRGTTLSGQLQYTYTNRNGVNVSGNNYTSIIRDAVMYRPIEPIVSDGLEEGGVDPTDASDKYLYDPEKTLKNTDRKNRSHNIRGVVSLNQKFGKHWTLNLNGNFQRTDTKQSVFYGEETQQGKRGENGVNTTLTHSDVLLLSGTATLSYSLKRKNRELTVMAGAEASSRTNEIYTFGNSQFPTDIFGVDKIQLGTSPSLPTSYRGVSTLASFFGRVNYSLFGGRYLVQANMRADGSSKFTKANRWGYFPSVSAAWRLSEEKFLKPVDWLSMLKIRGGWGLTGNNRIGEYDYLSYLDVITSGNTTSGYVWGAGEAYQPGAVLGNLGVPDLRWETTAQTSVGIDLGFLKNRITATVDWYYKHTYDLLLNADMAPSSGHRKVQQNVGEVSNRGWEFTINTVNIDRPNFSWSSSFNISFNRNKVLKLNGSQREILTNPEFTGQFNEYAYISRVGEPVGQIYGLVYDGVYTWDDFNYDNETGTFSLKPGIPDNGSSALAPGNLRYVDQNNDGTINALDRVVIGDPTPKHFGGFTNDFVIFKHFDAQIFFQWSYGGKILNANRTVVGIAQANRYNKLDYVNNYWSPYHPTSDVNAMRYETYFGMPTKGNEVDTRCVEDASYLRLKSVSIGYTLPGRLSKKIGMKKLRIYVSAQNLITWTDYTGYDPDVSVGKYGALTPNLDYSAYPQKSLVIGGLDITF